MAWNNVKKICYSCNHFFDAEWNDETWERRGECLRPECIQQRAEIAKTAASLPTPIYDPNALFRGYSAAFDTHVTDRSHAMELAKAANAVPVDGWN